MNDFLQLSDSHQKFFETTGEKIEYARGQIMSWHDDQQDWAYYLGSGHIKTACSYQDGSETIIGYLRPGSTFSQSSAGFGHGGRTEMEFYAVQDCVLYRTKIMNFWSELQTNQLFSNDFLIMQIASEMMMVDRIILLGEHDLERRFIRWLLMMAKFYGESTSGGVLVATPQTHTEIAAWLGIRRETAGKLVRQYIEGNYISLKQKQLYIHTIAVLEKML